MRFVLIEEGLPFRPMAHAHAMKVGDALHGRAAPIILPGRCQD